MPPRSFRSELLQKLDEINVNPETIARNLRDVFVGETVTEQYDADNTGKLVLTKKVVSRNPKDVLTGAMMYDALRGGDLGLAPANLKKVAADSTEIVHKRFEVDSRVFAYEDGLEHTLAPPNTIVDEDED